MIKFIIGLFTMFVIGIGYYIKATSNSKPHSVDLHRHWTYKDEWHEFKNSPSFILVIIMILILISGIIIYLMSGVSAVESGTYYNHLSDVI